MKLDELFGNALVDAMMERVLASAKKAAHEQVELAASEVDLRKTASLALQIVNRMQGKDIVSMASVLSASLFLDAFISHFPNTEAMHKHIEETKDGPAQTPRPPSDKRD